MSVLASKPSTCSGCPLATLGQGYVEGSGPLTARLLIIGDAPEEYSEALDYHLNKALLGERDLVRVDNTRRCLPPKKESSDVYARSIAHCSAAYLGRGLPEMAEYRTILVVGGDALREIVGISNISNVVGSVWTREEVLAIRAATRPTTPPLQLPPRLHSVVASIHPAAALRGARHLMPTIYQMIQRARALSMEDSLG